MVFLLQDTTTLDYTSHIHCEGLGPTGPDERMRGLHQQNVLAVDPQTRRPLGLLYQRHHRRHVRPPGHRRDRAAKRGVRVEERESYWWIEAIQAVGSPPAGVRWVHVGDRGEDIFGVYDEARRQGTDWLIRMAYDRRVQTPDGPDSLFSYTRRWSSIARRHLTVRRKNNVTLEEVHLSVSAGRLTLMPSRYEPAYRACIPIECWVVRVWEEEPSAGIEPLEWLLCSSLACETPTAALFVADGYSFRWMIEELHKCEKNRLPSGDAPAGACGSA
jgi:hypothetical protein